MAQLRSLSSSHRAIRLVYYTSSGSSSRHLLPAPTSAFSAINASRVDQKRRLHSAASDAAGGSASRRGCSKNNKNILSKKIQQNQRLQWLNPFLGSSSNDQTATRFVHQSAAPDQQAQVAIAEMHNSRAKRVAEECSENRPSPKNEEKPLRDPLDVSFNDPIAAFKSKTTWELVRAYMVYTICSSEKVVEHNMKVSAAIKPKIIYFIYNANSIEKCCWTSLYTQFPFLPALYTFLKYENRQMLWKRLALLPLLSSKLINWCGKIYPVGLFLLPSHRATC